MERRPRKALGKERNMNKAKLVVVFTMLLTALVVATNPVNAAVMITSNGIIMNVVTQPPVITVDPVGTKVYETETVNLSITASGVGLTYHWRLGGVNLVDGVDAGGTTIAGALTPNLTLTTALGSNVDSGAYDCVVSNVIASVTSNSAAVDIYTWPTIVNVSNPVANAPVPPSSDGELFVQDSTGPVTFTVTITPAGAHPAPIPTLAQIANQWNVEPLVSRNPYVFGAKQPVPLSVPRVAISNVIYTGDKVTFQTVLTPTDEGRYTCDTTVSAQ